MINVWDVTAQTDHEKYRRRSDVIAVQKNKNLLLALMMEEWIPKIRNNRTLPRFGTRVEKDMEHESQGYTTSGRCPRNNTHEVKELVKGNRY